MSGALSVVVRTMECDAAIQLDTEARTIRQLQPAVDRHRLAGELRMEHGHHLVGPRGHHQEFGERTVMTCNDEMIAVDTGAMRNDQCAAAVRESGDLLQLGEPAAPAHIRLDDVTAAHL